MRSLFPVLFFLVFMTCDSKKPDQQAIVDMAQNEAMEEDLPGIHDDVFNDIIQQIPSPLEISVLLKEVGSKYDNELLNPSENTSKYNSNFKKALNLGIYGTDLGYTNIYEHNQDALFYLEAIKTLAEDLSIGQFFDFGTIKRLAANSRNVDSLLLISTKNFNHINHYLQEQRRSNLSVLLLTGGWLEALHISCQVYAGNPGNVELQERIGEQKIILENILLLLSFYGKDDPNVKSLIGELDGLKKVFDQIEITYTYKESTYDVVDGVLMIHDNSTSSINITDEHLNDITGITSSIRNGIIS